MLINAVAPFAGAWIEIKLQARMSQKGAAVAPFAGAWIEMRLAQKNSFHQACRSLRGSVD